MTIKCLSLIVCDEVRREVNGKFLVVGMYTDVDFEAQPDDRQITVVASFVGVPTGEHDIELLVADYAAKKSFKTGERKFLSEGENKICLLILEIEDFDFPSSGTYSFTALIDEDPVGSLPITVNFPSENEEEGSSDKPE